LATVLDAIPTDTGVNIELKHVGIADDVLGIAAQIDNTVLYSSFQPAALSEVQTVDPTANCALLFADASGEIGTDSNESRLHCDPPEIRSCSQQLT